MTRFLRSLSCAVFMAGFAVLGTAHAQKGDTVRPEVGKPLQAAQALVKARKGRDALAEVAKAEAVPNRTAYENFLIQQMRGSAAVLAGENETAIKAFEAVLNSGRVKGRDATQMVQAIAVAHYQKKDYGRAAQWTQRYFKEGGNDPQMRTVLLQSYFLANDCASVSRMVGAAMEEASRRPSEEELQMLANCYLRQNNTGAYVDAIKKLVVHYPKKQYWTDLMARVQKKPGFSDRLGLHVYRLRAATGNLTSANDYMEMAQLALQAGVPAEAKAVIDKGYASGALGKGEQADRHGRLRDLAQKSLAESQAKREQELQEAQAAKDGNALVALGLNFVHEGNAAKGLQLIEQGIKKGGLRRPDDAKLALGEAQYLAGQKDRAARTLRDVKGKDGTADLAELWVLHARA